MFSVCTSEYHVQCVPKCGLHRIGCCTWRKESLAALRLCSSTLEANAVQGLLWSGVSSPYQSKHALGTVNVPVTEEGQCVRQLSDCGQCANVSKASPHSIPWQAAATQYINLGVRPSSQKMTSRIKTCTHSQRHRYRDIIRKGDKLSPHSIPRDDYLRCRPIIVKGDNLSQFADTQSQRPRCHPIIQTSDKLS